MEGDGDYEPIFDPSGGRRLLAEAVDHDGLDAPDALSAAARSLAALEKPVQPEPVHGARRSCVRVPNRTITKALQEFTDVELCKRKH